MMSLEAGIQILSLAMLLHLYHVDLIALIMMIKSVKILHVGYS